MPPGSTERVILTARSRNTNNCSKQGHSGDSLMGLVPQPPGRIEGGRAMFDGIYLLHGSPREARRIRGKRIAMIFQDPMTSLNPYLRISAQLIEPLLIHEKISRND